MSTDWTKVEPPLAPWILETVALRGFTDMTPVQASTIPLLLKHKDVVVEAVTGSGKTLAFLIPLLQRLGQITSSDVKQGDVLGVIISPTRELASQIHSVLDGFLQVLPAELTSIISSALLIGGTTSVREDLQSLKSTLPTILIGTPGRLCEIITSSASPLNLKSLELLIMDEADRLLDMGFKESVTKIVQSLPKQRRTGLFSATMTDAVSELVRTGLRNPVRVVVKVTGFKNGREKRTPASLQIGYMVVEPKEKVLQLIRLLVHALSQNLTKSIVYFPTCAMVDYFYPLLSNLPLLNQHKIISLHGQLPPSARQKNFALFCSIDLPCILLTTDVAARGLDVPSVDLVIQLDPPQDPKSFSHRCGRAGRAGRSGKAVVMLCEGREEEYVDLLKVRGMPVEPVHRIDSRGEKLAGEDTEGVRHLVEQFRNFVKTDRGFHDKAMKAFPSYVKAYSKHQANFIFRVNEMDISAIAYSWGLLRLPKMPELKLREYTWDPTDVDWDTYSYSDPQKENARLEASKKEVVQVARKTATDKKAWSEKTAVKERKGERREKRKMIKDKLRKEREEARLKEMAEDEDELEEDWKELRRERKRVKLAKGKKGEDDNDINGDLSFDLVG